MHDDALYGNNSLGWGASHMASLHGIEHESGDSGLGSRPLSARETLCRCHAARRQRDHPSDWHGGADVWTAATMPIPHRRPGCMTTTTQHGAAWTVRQQQHRVLCTLTHSSMSRCAAEATTRADKDAQRSRRGVCTVSLLHLRTQLRYSQSDPCCRVRWEEIASCMTQTGVHAACSSQSIDMYHHGSEDRQASSPFLTPQLLAPATPRIPSCTAVCSTMDRPVLA
jgi:hypothetical protein